MTTSDDLALKKFKAEFRDRRGVQVNSAGVGPAANRTAMRAIAMITEFNRNGALHERETLAQLKAARENLSGFLGCEVAELAYTQNCAAGLSQIAFGQDLKPGDKVVTIDQEYASNFYPWKVACERARAILVVVQSDAQKHVRLEQVLSAIVPGVKCVGISWIEFQTGAMLDLKRIGDHCHAVGAKLVVDGIQGIGQLPISFRDLPIDALVGGSHKWLCSINGQGFLVVKRDWLQDLQPILVGSGTFNRFGTFAEDSAPMEISARKFESGGLNFTGIFALDEAIALQKETGRELIASEIGRLNARLRSGLQRLAARGVALVTPVHQAGGITSFRLNLESEQTLMKLCQEQDCTIVKRGEFMRISLHAFNTDADVDQTLSLIEAALNGVTGEAHEKR